SVVTQKYVDVYPALDTSNPENPPKLKHITVRWRILHADSDVSFGKNKCPQVQFVDGNLVVLVPASDVLGAVAVRIQDRTNGQTAVLQAAFTYLGPNQATRAHVFRVEP